MAKRLDDFFSKRYALGKERIHTCPELIECIGEIGFLPLLESGIDGFSAEAMMAEECQFVQFDDGSWEWPLWNWKGSAVREGGAASALLPRLAALKT